MHTDAQGVYARACARRFIHVYVTVLKSACVTGEAVCKRADEEDGRDDSARADVSAQARHRQDAYGGP